MKKKQLETEVLIIGGGITGTGILRDLSLRGVPCILVEKNDINSGASGANHGLLHSGARYVFKDRLSAIECKIENERLKKNAPHCIENTQGIFAAFQGDDEQYIEDFPRYCFDAGIRCEKLDIKDAHSLEPQLSDQLIAAYLVDDATVDPFKLSLENITESQQLGSDVYCYCNVTGFDISNHTVQSAYLQNTQTGEQIIIKAKQFVNAGGAWAGYIAEKAGCSLDILLSKGTLLVTHHRLTTRVINRLRPPSDADILAPGGNVSILGTTSTIVQTPAKSYPTVEEIDLIVNDAKTMLPILENTRFIRAYSGLRPLVSSKTTSLKSDRSVSREFSLLEHNEDGIDNFLTITGGKLTTFRHMAEKASDRICERLKITTDCLTQKMPLPVSSTAKWTEPGFSPKYWAAQKKPNDQLLCECEMVSQSAVDDIIENISKQHIAPDLISLGLRSRVGKGSCQGSFCSLRIIAYLYDQLKIEGDSGLKSIKDFIRNRWHGEHSILWDQQLCQSELTEAMHCGFLSLEANDF